MSRLQSISKVVVAIHYAYPILTFLCFAAATLASIFLSRTSALTVEKRNVRRKAIVGLMSVVTVELIIESFLLILRAFTLNDENPAQDEIIYRLSSAVTWAIQGLALQDSKFPVWYPYYVNWVLGIFLEFTLLILAFVSLTLKNPFDFAMIAFQGVRACILMTILGLCIGLRNRKRARDVKNIERQPLLNNVSAADQSNTGSEIRSTAVGSTNNDDSEEDLEDDEWLKSKQKDKERIAKRLERDGNWWTYTKGFAIFFPLVWPVHSKALQARAILVAVCLMGVNFLNVLVPRQLGAIIDALMSENARDSLTAIALYVFINFAKSASCIGWLQDWLWKPVEDYAYDTLNTAAQSHVMSLSLDFHASKEANDIFMDIFKGRNIISLVNTVCFEIMPMFVDLVLVLGYLYYLFGPYMALILGVTIFIYLYTSSKLTEVGDKKRRRYHAHYRREWKASQSTIRKWLLATYFDNIVHENEHYSSMIKKRLDSQRAFDYFVNCGAAAKSLIMTMGLLGACLLAVYQVLHKHGSPGDFVALPMYWSQLQVSLSAFANTYKSISENMMDAERLLELIQIKPTIVNDKDAKPLNFIEGKVVFDSVSFAYDKRKSSLEDISFTVPGGSTVAIVGETGGGKSTILKLLDRLYDVTDGSIKIDGQDIRRVTLERKGFKLTLLRDFSIRGTFGVVAQDSMLFHDTIMNNVRYGRQSATDEEVREACRSATMHDKIMGFPDGYRSKVGTNGLKLSGGEKQRLAIARAFLKNPRIVLLDEATSSVDTGTEVLIHEAFRKLCSGRTTFMIAHRLSTVVKADQIIVVKDGQIVEKGTHKELIDKKGNYYDLWSKQILLDTDIEKP